MNAYCYHQEDKVDSVELPPPAQQAFVIDPEAHHATPAGAAGGKEWSSDRWSKEWRTVARQFQPCRCVNPTIMSCENLGRAIGTAPMTWATNEKISRQTNSVPNRWADNFTSFRASSKNHTMRPRVMFRKALSQRGARRRKSVKMVLCGVLYRSYT